jgi:hypothetical protein
MANTAPGRPASASRYRLGIEVMVATTKEAADLGVPLLPETVPVPSVLNLKEDDHHDGCHQDRPGHYRQYRKHSEVPDRQCAGTCNGVGSFQPNWATKVETDPVPKRMYYFGGLSSLESQPMADSIGSASTR